jgi:hypothetical protein
MNRRCPRYRRGPLAQAQPQIPQPSALHLYWYDTDGTLGRLSSINVRMDMDLFRYEVIAVRVAQDLLSSIMREVKGILDNHEKLDCNMCVHNTF